jgi:hypothetical protein
MSIKDEFSDWSDEEIEKAYNYIDWAQIEKKGFTTQLQRLRRLLSQRVYLLRNQTQRLDKM